MSMYADRIQLKFMQDIEAACGIKPVTGQYLSRDQRASVTVFRKSWVVRRKLEGMWILYGYGSVLNQDSMEPLIEFIDRYFHPDG